jgi:magnesium-transporting ATPase (P-type)
MMNVKNAK